MSKCNRVRHVASFVHACALLNFGVEFSGGNVAPFVHAWAFSRKEFRGLVFIISCRPSSFGCVSVIGSAMRELCALYGVVGHGVHGILRAPAPYC